MEKLIRIGLRGIIIAYSIDFFYVRSGDAFVLSRYSPLNEVDRYVYFHYEDSDEDLVTITVKNVRNIGQIKQFDFLWQGKYNDRMQTSKFTSEVSVEAGKFKCLHFF